MLFGETQGSDGDVLFDVQLAEQHSRRVEEHRGALDLVNWELVVGLLAADDLVLAYTYGIIDCVWKKSQLDLDAATQCTVYWTM